MGVREDVIRTLAAVLDARGPLHGFAADWDDGIVQRSSSTMDGHSDPVGGRVVGPTPSTEKADEGRRQLVEGAGLGEKCASACTRIDALLVEIRELGSEVKRLLPIDHPIAEMLARFDEARWNGAGTCVRCGEGVTGGVGQVQVDGRLVADKIDAGYCPTCKSAWRKSGLDRGMFNGTWSREKAELRVRLRASKNGTGGGTESAGDASVVDGRGNDVATESSVSPEAGVA